MWNCATIWRQETYCPGKWQGFPVEDNGEKHKDAPHTSWPGDEVAHSDLRIVLPCSKACAADNGGHEEVAVHGFANSLLHHSCGRHCVDSVQAARLVLEEKVCRGQKQDSRKGEWAI